MKERLWVGRDRDGALFTTKMEMSTKETGTKTNATVSASIAISTLTATRAIGTKTTAKVTENQNTKS